MSKVILHISYEIEASKREEYLALAQELKTQFLQTEKKDYTIYEVKGKKNFFVEEFVCKSMEEYEVLEDSMTESGEALVNRLEALLKDGKAKYATLLEI
jgi:hypothetical protein